jgi:hypothetical protein
MATAGVMNGTKLRLYVDQAGGSTFTAIGTSMDVTLNFTHSPRETTNQDSQGHASFLEGKRVKTIDANFLMSEDGANAFADWYATLDSETLRGFCTAKVATATTGDSTYTYNCYITSLSVQSGGPEANATCSVSLQVTGKGATGTVS